MTRINEAFFKMAQSSAKTATELTSDHAGQFDWAIAMDFLKMAYYRCTVEDMEGFIRDVEKVLNRD